MSSLLAPLESGVECSPDSSGGDVPFGEGRAKSGVHLIESSVKLVSVEIEREVAHDGPIGGGRSSGESLEEMAAMV